MTAASLALLDPIYTELTHVVNPVYMVGGCVRDALLGIEPHDFDAATPLLPEEVENCVRAAGRRPYLVGKRFGTIGFKVNGSMVEVTTFRNEAYQLHCRRPKVSFVSCLETDLARRDFTINALAYNGSVIDPHQGIQDLTDRILRCVGVPANRFADDPLRMVRGARFVAQLGLTVDSETHIAMGELAHQILDVAIERTMVELDKLFAVQDMLWCTRGLRLLHETKVINHLLPELFLIDSDDFTDCFTSLVMQILHQLNNEDTITSLNDELIKQAKHHHLRDVRWLAMFALTFNLLVPPSLQITNAACGAHAHTSGALFVQYMNRFAKSLRMPNHRIRILKHYAELFTHP